MDLFYFLFLIPLTVIGIICSYTDIKYKKIFNKWIVSSFIYIFLLYCFLFLFLKDNVYIINLILNGVIAFLVGYLLWHFKLWSAGDAKLFSVYAFLMPLSFYSKSYVFYFPSFNLLVNLFVPLLLVIIISALMIFLKEITKTKRIKEKIKGINLEKSIHFLLYLFQLFLNYVFIFIVLNLIIFPLTGKIPGSEVFQNPFFIFALLLLIIGRFHKARENKKQLNWILYGVILIYLFFIVFWEKDFNALINVLRVSFVFMVFIGLTRNILSFYIQKKEVKIIKIKNIKEGMVVVKDKDSFFLNEIKDKVGTIDAGGLNEKQVKIIKDFFKNNQKAEIKIYKTFPFAPFLFLSAVISILTQSSFLASIDNVFKYLI